MGQADATAAVPEFKVLGPLAVARDGAEVELRSTAVRRLLGALLCRPRQPVPLTELFEAVWPNGPPKSARTALQVYVHRLRNILGAQQIEHTPEGYRLITGSGDIDAGRFEELIGQARLARSRKQARQALDALRSALALWRGDPYAGLGAGPLVAAEAHRLRELHLLAHEECFAVELELGHHTEIIPRLHHLTRAFPYQETLRAQLMLALYRTGRQADALETYRDTREFLRAELGIEPAPALQRLHEAILRGDPALDPSPTAVDAEAEQATRSATPQQVPHAVAGFVGRDEELGALDRRIAGSGSDSDGSVALITGTAGVGKTALALHWAHHNAHRFPDGQLYLNLRGDDTDQQRRLDLLKAGGDPHAAVTTVFSWSIDHLPAPVADTFRLLSLHPGPEFDGYAAAALAGTDLREADRRLGQLCRAHLIHETARRRYAMHDLLLAYAQRLCLDHDSEEARRRAQTRLLDYYLTTAAAAMDRLHPAEKTRRPQPPAARTPAPELRDEDATAWLDTELPNLVAIATHTDSGGLADHLIRLSWTLDRYLDHGRHHEALTIHGAAYKAAQQIHHDIGQARALFSLGAVHMQLGRHERAADYLRRALDLFTRNGDKSEQARCLGDLGVIDQRLGEYDRAIGWYRQALAAYAATGERSGPARILSSLGIVEQRLGNHSAAIDNHRQALELYRQTGDLTAQAVAMNNLGSAEQKAGEYALAARHIEAAIDLYRRSGNRNGEAAAADNLGLVLTSLGRPQEATAQHQHALDQFQSSGHRYGQVWALNGLGEAAQAAGRPAEAAAHHANALAIAREIGSREQEARALTGLGRSHAAQGSRAQARDEYRHALDLYTALKMPDADEVRALLHAL